MRLRIFETFVPTTPNDEINESLLEAYGNDISQPPPPGCSRLAFQNAQGIDRWPEPAREILDATEQFDINIYGVAEPNAIFNDEFKIAINASIKQRFGCGNISAASCPSKRKSGYNPGGIMQLIRGKPTGRLVDHKVDRLGRMSWMTLRGTNDRKLCIISCYRVVQTKGTVPQNRESNTVHWQQVQQMIKDGKSDPDPRNQVLKDMSKLINEKKEDGCEVVVMIDANESVEGPKSKWNEFMQDNLLHDIQEMVVPILPQSTRTRSSKRIDFMVATEGILQHVRAGGFRPLHEQVSSDHIALWADIDLETFFGGEGPSIVPPQARDFSYDNGEMRRKFIKELRTIHDHQQLPRRIRSLEKEFIVFGSTPERVVRYNRLDDELVRAIKTAINNVVKQKQHGYHRSPALTKAGNQVLFWKSVLSSKRNSISVTPRAVQLAERNNIDLDIATIASHDDAYAQVRKAWNHLKECQRESIELRSKWLESIARTKAVVNNTEEAKELKLVIAKLHNKRMHQKLNRIVKGDHQALDFIEIPTAEWYYSASENELYHYSKGVFETHAPHTTLPRRFHKHHTLKVIPDDAMQVEVVTWHDEEGNDVGYKVARGLPVAPIEWQRITEKNEIEVKLMERNKRHLQQMALELSPPSQGNFKELLDNFGNSVLTEKILEGEVTNELDQFPRVIRTWLQQFKRTEEEREKVIPIDGFIYTHEFQRAFESVNEKTSSSPSGINYTLWKCMASDTGMASYLVIMMRLPFIHGFANDRWTRCLDVMLEKKKGVRKIHQLRIIGLVEADFNTALKLFFAKQMMANAERTTLSEEQWGGRPGRTAVEPALRKMLAFEYGRLMYVTIALFANDAVACFDRMVPNISTIVARKYGVQPLVMQSRNLIMSKMEHSVRTRHGDSTTTYKQDAHDAQLAGETQGKGDVASLWSAESQSLLTAHQKLHEGITLRSANKKRAITKNNDAFVDDCDGMASKRQKTFGESERMTRKHLEKGAQIWAILILASGGAIARHKSAWHMLAWIDGTSPPEMKEMPSGSVSLTDHHGHRTKIKKLSSSTPNKGLGCRQAVDGNMDKEHEFRVSQCRGLAASAQPARLNPREANMMMSSRICPTVSYPMASTTFSKTQCSKLNKIIDPILLPKHKVNRKMPRAAVFAPLSLAGMNYTSFQVCQDQKGLMKLIQQLRWNSTVANDMLVVLSAVQLMSGLCEPVMEDVSTDLSYVGGGWFTHQRSRLKELNATTWIEHQWTPQLQRGNDQSLMKAFSLDEKATKHQILVANSCRVYLRVITVAELANEKGTMIPGDRLNGKWQAPSTLEWPAVPCPPKHHWAIFRMLFRRSFANKRRANSSLSAPITLDNPLGNWSITERHIQYEFYRTQRAAFKRSGSTFQVYNEPTSSEIFFHEGETDELPNNAIPISARHDDNELWTNEGYNADTIPTQQPTIEIASTPHPRPNMGGSDGSADIVSGGRSHAAVIHHNGTRYMSRQRFSSSDYVSSYRAELEGIKSIIDIADVHQVPSVHHTCDNKSAVENVNNVFTTQSQTMAPEADIIMAIHKQREQSNTKFVLTWIKAHQDDKKKYEELDDEAQLNVDVDEAAGEERVNGRIVSPQPYEGSGAMLIIDGKWVTTKYREQIHLASTRPAHIKFFLKKYRKEGKTLDDYNSIYWRGIGNARKNLHSPENIRIMKLMNGWLNTGRQKKHFHGHTGLCPSCGTAEETQMHIHQCVHESRKENRKEAFKLLEKYYHQHDIPANVYVPFVRMCWLACEGADLVIHENLLPEITKAVENQRRLGGEFLLRGYLTRDWLDALIIHAKQQPEQKLNHLYIGLWITLFKTIWEKRNDDLHGKNNVVEEYERQQLANELMEWRNQSHARLGANQQYLTSYTHKDIMTWRTTTMRENVNLLVKAAGNRNDELLGISQRRIPEFFIPIHYDDSTQ